MLSAETASNTETALDAIGSRIVDKGQEDAFFVADLHAVNVLYDAWQAAFPAVAPFYAVKCNPDPNVMAALAKRGAGFDCASLGEMQQVLGLGIEASRIIFANPSKIESHIRFARANGIRRMTFDSVEEAEKLAALYPDAALVLRITTDDSQSTYKFSKKFGASPAQIPAVLAAAKQRGLEVVGVSFHVGSDCRNPAAYAVAMRDAAQAFAEAARLGYTPTLLDIGGGFDGHTHKWKASLATISAIIHAALQEHFAGYESLEVIAEPGRYFVESVFTLAARIYSKRRLPGEMMYYLNDGVYGCLNGKLCGEPPHVFQLFRRGATLAPVPPGPTSLSYVWGPTLDGFDLVADRVQLPELMTDDWLVFPNMGAYYLAIRTSFNGYPCPQIFLIND